MPFNITNFTVSSSIELYRNGKKQSHFNSVAISVAEEDEESIKEFRSRMALECYKNNVKDALMSSFISLEEAKDLISTAKSNHDVIYLKQEK